MVLRRVNRPAYSFIGYCKGVPLRVRISISPDDVYKVDDAYYLHASELDIRTLNEHPLSS